MKTPITADTYSDYARLRIENLRKTLKEIESSGFIDAQDPSLMKVRNSFHLNIAELEADLDAHRHKNGPRSVPALKVALAIKY